MSWTMVEISAGVGMAPDVLDEPARSLVAAGLLVQAHGRTFRLASMDAPTSQAVMRLVKLYEDDKLLVVRALTQLAMERLRSSAARTFADAFIIRRNKPAGRP